MQTGKQRPFISQKNVRQALDSLVYSIPKSDSPLLYLLLVEEFLLNPDLPDMADPREYALASILVSSITREFLRLRQVLGLAWSDGSSSREDILKSIAEEAKAASPELVGWSWLYHHFVMVDLNISLQDFCAAAHIDERTLRRYQNHIVKRLTDLLIDAEWEVRTLQRKRRLCSELPVSSMFPIVGREDSIAHVIRILTESGASHFQITGPKGVGKTAFVERVLRILIDDESVDQLIWLDKPPTCEYIRYQLLERLLPIQSHIGLSEFFQIYQSVIVIDGAEGLCEDREELNQLLKLFANTTVFIISQYDVSIPNTIQIALVELDRANAYDLIRQIFKLVHDDEEISEDTVHLIQRQIGGNPLALQLTVMNWSRMNTQEFSSNVGLDAIFADIFEAMSRDLKCAWIALAMLGLKTLRYSDLHDMWPQHIASRNINDLLNHHLLQISSDHKGYVLIDSARNYVIARYKDDLELRGITMILLEDLDNANGVDVTCIENILLSDWIVIEETQRKNWIDKWWQIGLLNHHWSNWRLLLKDEAQSASPEIPLAIGYASCLRHLGEIDSVRMYLSELVQIMGRKGAFADQALTMTELAIVERQTGAYERAAAWLNRAGQIAIRLGLDSLSEKLTIEQSQIAVDVRDIETFAELMARLPDTRRANLLRSEMLFLWNDLQSSRQIAEVILRSPDLELTTKAHVHNILGRIYQQLGDLQKAEEHFSWCLMILEKSDDVFFIARAQVNLGNILLRLKFFEEARILFTSAEAQQLLLSDLVGLASTRHNLKQLEIDVATS